MTKHTKFLASFLTSVTCLLMVWPALSLHAREIDQFSYDYAAEINQESASAEADSKIQFLFNSLETLGNSYNSGDAASVQQAAIELGCRKGMESLSQMNVTYDLSEDIYYNLPLAAAPRDWVWEKGKTLTRSAMDSLCMALKGEQIGGMDVKGSIQSAIDTEFIPMLVNKGIDMAHESGMPLLTRLEIELGSREGNFVSSITTVQPMWHDKSEKHHLFGQLSWHAAPDELNDDGYREQLDTFNAGLAYRQLSDDKKYLYGANMFYDYAPERDHTRLSIGVDARTSQLFFAANRYIPLSGWKSRTLYYEDRAAGGWDAEINGQVPELPSWTASLKGYEWDEQDKDADLYGLAANIEYSPVPAMAVRVGVRDDSQNSPSMEAALRFNMRFDQPQSLQWRQKTALAPVSDYVYEKVHRENIIRIKSRRKASSKLTVTQTVGSNTSVSEDGTLSLTQGQVLLMPVTVTTANSSGAVARLRTSRGGFITLGQNTQIYVTPDLITLSSGTLQYVSDGNIQNVTTPGGTIELQGTDIDVVTDGTNSSVRVRDGAVTFTGTVSGSSTLAAGEMGRTVAGVIAGVAEDNAYYTTHTDQVSEQIDRIASQQTGVKVAPYPYEAPYFITEVNTPGEVLKIGLKYNDVVNVSGAPVLNLTINSASRTASYVSGSGTNELVFEYTIQGADENATSITVTSLSKNGGSITGNGKEAVTTIADATITFDVAIADEYAPTGFAAVFTTDPVNIANEAAGAFNITSAEVGSDYAYTISSAGGGADVTGSGTVSGTTESFTGLDLSGLGDGTLTVSVTLTDTEGNVSTAVTDTVTKDTVAPTVSSVTPPANATFEP